VPLKRDRFVIILAGSTSCIIVSIVFLGIRGIFNVKDLNDHCINIQQMFNVNSNIYVVSVVKSLAQGIALSNMANRSGRNGKLRLGWPLIRFAA